MFIFDTSAFIGTNIYQQYLSSHFRFLDFFRKGFLCVDLPVFRIKIILIWNDPDPWIPILEFQSLDPNP